ncbi:CMRF35-like molecule 5 [Xyrichtys novacula]|uniref:CMRF35-like molecule 5 n=1 Tax=Xyrichtys novacula TaxID=13765 RepID=A0AAV1EWW2_XYRNO|nr:CMRF35-like molecule 5 [Xyrichtys novacula]
MGGNWGATTFVILTLLHNQALISAQTTVGGTEGHSFDFRCEYPANLEKNTKYFCLVDNNVCNANTLIRTETQMQRVRVGRFSMFDNTTGGFFTVTVDKLTFKDSGMYWCGVDIKLYPDRITVIQLNVSQATVSPPTDSPKESTVDRLHAPLYLTAVMCVAAIFCVCMFTLCLLLVVKQQRSNAQRNRETSADYETMVPGVTTEPQLYCSCSDPDCTGLPALPPPPPDLWSHFTSKQSSVTSEYVDVDVSGHICLYQHLDPGQLEQHVYHCLNKDNSVKDGPGGVKEWIN